MMMSTKRNNDAIATTTLSDIQPSSTTNAVVTLASPSPESHQPTFTPPTDSQLQKWSFFKKFRPTPNFGYFGAIPVGATVSIRNLKKRPELNGQRGRVLKYDYARDRYGVVLDEHPGLEMFTQKQLLHHLQITIHGLQKSPQLNGKVGTVCGWDADKGRYNVYLGDDYNKFKITDAEEAKNMVGLKPYNMILFEGTSALIYGLASQPQYNGKFGKVLKWHATTNKYDVQVSSQSIIRINVSNLRL